MLLHSNAGCTSANFTLPFQCNACKPFSTLLLSHLSFLLPLPIDNGRRSGSQPIPIAHFLIYTRPSHSPTVPRL